jgi:hypothetical protein
MSKSKKRDEIEIVSSLVIITVLSIIKQFVLKKEIVFHEIVITTVFILLSKYTCLRFMNEVDKQIKPKKKSKKK